MSQIQNIINDFASNLTAAIEASVRERALAAFRVAMGEPRNGHIALSPVKHRRNGPVQLCPVPGCGGRAAPVFGMVCAAHKGVAKAKIAKYHEARRQAKAKGARA